MRGPNTLIKVIDHFRDYQNCHDFLVAIRWPTGVVCPHCADHGPTVHGERAPLEVPRAAPPRRKFGLKTGSVFEDSPIPLPKWLAATWMIVNCRNGVSSYEIHREIGVTQKTAWFMGIASAPPSTPAPSADAGRRRPRGRGRRA